MAFQVKNIYYSLLEDTVGLNCLKSIWSEFLKYNGAVLKKSSNCVAWRFHLSKQSFWCQMSNFKWPIFYLKGIFFRYDISAIKIKVKETHKSYFEFLIRLIGIIGGIYATSLMFHSSYESAKEFLCANMCAAGPAVSTRALDTQATSKLCDLKNPLLEVDNNNFSIPFLHNNTAWF